MRVLPHTGSRRGALLGALLLFLAAAAGASLLPNWMLPKLAGEINSNLLVYYLPLQFVGVAIALVYRKAIGARYAVLLAALLVALSVYDLVVLRKFFASGAWDGDSLRPEIVFISADLEGSSQQLAAIEAEVTASQLPMVVGLSGVTADIAAVLRQELSALTVVATEPRDDGYGLALLTRGIEVTLMGTAVGQPFEGLPPVLTAQLLDPSWPLVEISVLRLPVPLTKQAWQVSDLVTRRIFVPLRNNRSTFVVLGNFNRTPTSTTYRRALWATKGRNAMEGFGYQRSCCFPSPWLRFPVNHVLYGGMLEGQDFKVLSAPGRIAPVVAELRKALGGESPAATR